MQEKAKCCIGKCFTKCHILSFDPKTSKWELPLDYRVWKEEDLKRVWLYYENQQW